MTIFSHKIRLLSINSKLIIILYFIHKIDNIKNGEYKIVELYKI